MHVDLLSICEVKKVLPVRPKWEALDSVWFCLNGSLDIEGETIAGLELRGGACQTLPDRAVRFQLQYYPPKGPCTPLSRIEWRPMAPHTNPACGPQELQLMRMTGSHVHAFELNWMDNEGRMRAGNLPIARPLERDPGTFEELLEVVAKEFRISNLIIEKPSWRMSDLFGI